MDVVFTTGWEKEMEDGRDRQNQETDMGMDLFLQRREGGKRECLDI